MFASSEAARAASLARFTPEQIARAEARRTALAERRGAPCPHCGGTLGRGRSKTCGSVECKRLYHNARMAKFQSEFRAANGQSYAARMYGDRFFEVRRAERRSAGYTEAKRAGDARRRARKKGARIESFTNVEIFERDGWVCGICTEPVDATLAYPDPMSPSLDHEVPLSLGGDHSRDNTRLAHLTCNVKRGNRVA